MFAWILDVEMFLASRHIVCVMPYGMSKSVVSWTWEEEKCSKNEIL
jgi:hypothetical protein